MALTHIPERANEGSPSRRCWAHPIGAARIRALLTHIPQVPWSPQMAERLPEDPSRFWNCMETGASFFTLREGCGLSRPNCSSSCHGLPLFLSCAESLLCTWAFHYCETSPPQPNKVLRESSRNQTRGSLWVPLNSSYSTVLWFCEFLLLQRQDLLHWICMKASSSWAGRMHPAQPAVLCPRKRMRLSPQVLQGPEFSLWAPRKKMLLLVEKRD